MALWDRLIVSAKTTGHIFHAKQACDDAVPSACKYYYSSDAEASLVCKLHCVSRVLAEHNKHVGTHTPITIAHFCNILQRSVANFELTPAKASARALECILTSLSSLARQTLRSHEESADIGVVDTRVLLSTIVIVFESYRSTGLPPPLLPACLKMLHDGIRLFPFLNAQCQAEPPPCNCSLCKSLAHLLPGSLSFGVFECPSDTSVSVWLREKCINCVRAALVLYAAHRDRDSAMVASPECGIVDLGIVSMLNVRLAAILGAGMCTGLLSTVESADDTVDELQYHIEFSRLVHCTLDHSSTFSRFLSDCLALCSRSAVVRIPETSLSSHCQVSLPKVVVTALLCMNFDPLQLFPALHSSHCMLRSMRCMQLFAGALAENAKACLAYTAEMLEYGNSNDEYDTDDDDTSIDTSAALAKARSEDFWQLLQQMCPPDQLSLLKHPHYAWTRAVTVERISLPAERNSS
jgi:hypothetical protein